jgi:hypothetical protein
MPKLRKFIFPLIVAAVLMPGVAKADTVLSIQPTSTSASKGNTVTLDVNISGVTDLYSWQFDVDFDPSVLTATGITEGPFLSGGGSTFFIPGTIDNVGGSIAFNGDTLLGPLPGVNGSGTLAILSFTAIGSGSSPVDPANEILLDSKGNNIDFSTENGTINISGTLAPVPEPSSFLMLGAGLLGLVGDAKWKLCMSRFLRR